jgi:formylglycine-generating enzyme required for sulfatase activity
MGSPEDELERSDDESPQHSVTIQLFCLGNIQSRRPNGKL